MCLSGNNKKSQNSDGKLLITRSELGTKRKKTDDIESIIAPNVDFIISGKEQIPSDSKSQDGSTKEKGPALTPAIKCHNNSASKSATKCHNNSASKSSQKSLEMISVQDIGIFKQEHPFLNTILEDYFKSINLDCEQLKKQIISEVKSIYITEQKNGNYSMNCITKDWQLVDKNIQEHIKQIFELIKQNQENQVQTLIQEEKKGIKNIGNIVEGIVKKVRYIIELANFSLLMQSPGGWEGWLQVELFRTYFSKLAVTREQG